MGIKVRNLKTVQERFRKLPKKIERAMRKTVVQATTLVHNDIVRSIREPGSGRTYTRGSISHQASAPGEPPASDTGRLLGSISTTIRVAREKVTGRVSTNVEYGPYLEFGTERIFPRPFFRPAAKRNRRKIRRLFGQNVRMSVRRG